MKHLNEHQMYKIWGTEHFVHRQSRIGSVHTLCVADSKIPLLPALISILQSRVLSYIHPRVKSSWYKGKLTHSPQSQK